MTDKRGVTSKDWDDLAAKYLEKYLECLSVAAALRLAENGNCQNMKELLTEYENNLKAGCDA